MSNKPEKKEEYQDDILKEFEEAKEEQMSLLDGFEEEKEVERHPEDAHWSLGEKVGREPKQKEQQKIEEDQKEEKIYRGTDGVEYSEHEWNSPALRNGPTRREIEGWKERFGQVYFTPFDDEVYVWRTLQRPEYREIISDTSLTTLDREEVFSEKCVLYPYDFSIEKIKKSRAGIASLLSEMIMDKSGFVAQSAPIKL